jgi:hypothetical protein
MFAEYEIYMGEMRNAYKILVRKPEDLGINGRKL